MRAIRRQMLWSVVNNEVRRNVKEFGHVILWGRPIFVALFWRDQALKAGKFYCDIKSPVEVLNPGPSE
jgi:hypothetical protein